MMARHRVTIAVLFSFALLALFSAASTSATPAAVSSVATTQFTTAACAEEPDCLAMSEGVLDHLLKEGTNPVSAGVTAGRAYALCVDFHC